MTSLGIKALLAVTYIAAQGDSLRLVCHKHYGRSDTEILRLVIDRNPFTVSKLQLDAGDIVVLPPAPVDQAAPSPLTIKVWDGLAYVRSGTKPKPKTPTRVPKEKLMAALLTYRQRKVVPVEDEEPLEPRPPLPYNAEDWVDLDDPFSLVTDSLANLR